jgi:exo-beta-1,3-glucanase (GH17 family)
MPESMPCLWSGTIPVRATLCCIVCLAIALFPANAPAQAICARNPAVTPALTRLRTTMAHGRWVDYQPTSQQVLYGHPTQADPASIRADLKVLRPRFDGLITYTAVNGAEAIPAIASELGFHALIIGVWNPFDAAELNAGLTAAQQHRNMVVGLSLGNEMLFFQQRKPDELTKLLDAVHTRAPWLALSTTEPFHEFGQPELHPVLLRMDFLLANVHPVFQPWFRTASNATSVQFVLNVVAQLQQQYCGPVLVKETGMPTAPEPVGYTVHKQAQFYAELAHRFPGSAEHAFAWFEAFDAPWRLKDYALGKAPAEEEAHWGLYDERRRPKEIVASIEPLD